jgi:hypothetical protein
VTLFDPADINAFCRLDFLRVVPGTEKHKLSAINAKYAVLLNRVKIT